MINQKRSFVRLFGIILVFVLAFTTFLKASAQTSGTNSGSHPLSTVRLFIPLIRTDIGPVAGIYYLSPTGDDSKSGKTPGEAWKNFDRALNSTTPGNKLQPGETLILLDGVYNQSLTPHLVSGSPGKPITIAAQHDGKAVIDGQGIRIPIYLEQWRNASYFVIKGIIARNSSQSVIQVTADNNTFQRVSGYNGNTNTNDHVFVIWANNTLVEDCIAAGSGRKMIVIFASTDRVGHNNTIRRCFASFREWDGRDWGDEWPWNENFEVYSGDYNILENNIAYGYFANAGFSLLSQSSDDNNIGNKILGSVAIMGGMDHESDPINWGNIRPLPTQSTLLKDIHDPWHRIGFLLWHAGIIRDNLLQDILAWGNAGMGIGALTMTPGMTNNIVNRATILNNGLDLPYYNGVNGIDAFQDSTSKLTITNSRINIIKGSWYPFPTFPPLTGEGARLQYRYIDGVLKDGSDGTAPQPLWPWPMEDRIRSEMGISVTNLISNVTTQAQLSQPVSPMPDTANIHPGPYLSAAPVSMPFGNARLGTSAVQPVTLKNLGTFPLTVSAYQFDSQGSSRFSITSGGTCPQLPFALAPSQSCTVNVAFTPLDYSAQSTYLRYISSEAAPYPELANTYLSGLGYGTLGPIAFPGKLEAEAYTDSGGYFDIAPTTDAGGSGVIGNITGGAWVKYPVNITQPGNYNITARIASINNGDNSVHFSIELDGITIGTVYPPNTGSWQTFTDTTLSNVSLSQGSHTLKIVLSTGWFDLNYLKFFLQ